jgi:hypothetical protein
MWTAAAMLWLGFAMPAAATDPTEPINPDEPGVVEAASELELRRQASDLELQSVAEQAAAAVRALAALEQDIAALRSRPAGS